MMIILKKKTVIAALVIFATVCLLGIAVGTAVFTEAKFAKATVGKTVVIDAGHGGRDGGVVGKVTGVKESDINLSIAKSLRHFLESKGYKVVMTRTTTDGLYGIATQNRKTKDMNTRKKIIADTQPDLVVSIHQNSFPSGLEHGAQVFYAPHSALGGQMAETVQNVLNANLNANRTHKKGDYFILQCSEYPSLLVECGFLSNAAEEQLLISAAYQEKVAYTIFTGIHTVLLDGAKKE